MFTRNFLCCTVYHLGKTVAAGRRGAGRGAVGGAGGRPAVPPPAALSDPWLCPAHLSLKNTERRMSHSKFFIAGAGWSWWVGVEWACLPCPAPPHITAAHHSHPVCCCLTADCWTDWSGCCPAEQPPPSPASLQHWPPHTSHNTTAPLPSTTPHTTTLSPLLAGPALQLARGGAGGRGGGRAGGLGGEGGGRMMGWPGGDSTASRPSQPVQDQATLHSPLTISSCTSVPQQLPLPAISSRPHSHCHNS